MEEKQKKIEDLNGFRDLRIVDNFYQTSAFFPMPTTILIYFITPLLPLQPLDMGISPPPRWRLKRSHCLSQ